MSKRKYIVGLAMAGCVAAVAGSAVAETTSPTPHPTPTVAVPSAQVDGTDSDVSLAVAAAQTIAHDDPGARAATLTTTIDEYLEHFGADAAGAIPEGTQVSVVAVTGSNLTASVHLPQGYPGADDLKATSVVVAIDSSGLQVSRSIQMTNSTGARGATSENDPKKLLEGFSADAEELTIR